MSDALRRRLPPRFGNVAARWKNILTTQAFFQICRHAPRLGKRVLRAGLARVLPDPAAVHTDFAPRYDPWDQRLCVVPDGDLFKAIRKDSVDIVTDTIETFDETGIQLTSGKHLDADIIVTATGLNMLAIGGLSVAVDGRDVVLSETVGYKGMMFSGVPNLAAAVGYTTASWTLKCDLACEYVCRLLNRMDERGLRQVTPRWTEPTLPTQPFVDLSSGYVLRSVDKFPKQGSKFPWQVHQNYLLDYRLLAKGPVEDHARFGHRTAVAQPAEVSA